jgi:hypothetical protein
MRREYQTEGGVTVEVIALLAGAEDAVLSCCFSLPTLSGREVCGEWEGESGVSGCGGGIALR